MTKPTAQACHAMTTYYVNTYTDYFDRAPRVNRNKARWGWDSILQDMSASEAKSLVDFWLSDSAAQNQDLDWFFYNYDKLIVMREEQEQAAARRRALMEQSRQRAIEWKERGNKTITQIEE